MADQLTVLISANGKHAGKHFSIGKDGGIKTRSYDGNEKYFRVHTVEVDGIKRLGAALVAIARNQFAFVIRGAPLPGINLKHARRLLRPEKKSGDLATFEEVPRHWVPIDVDHIPCPAAIDPKGDPEGAVEYVVGLLPDELSDATCWWQWSSSQSVFDNETLSLHLWFWADTPLTGDELKRWAVAANLRAGFKLIDPAMFRTVQALYTARPTFDAPLIDPLPRRSGVRQGLDDAVVLLIPPPASPKHPGQPGREDYEPGVGVEAFLAQIGGATGFREPIVKAIASYIASFGGAVDCEPLKEQIRAAIANADSGGRSADEIERYASDDHLDQIIAWVKDRHEDRPPTTRPLDPPFPLPSVTPAEIRSQIAHAILDFFKRCGDTPTPRVLVASATGTGKTQLLGEGLPYLIEAERAAGRPHRVIIPVPAHRLGAQICARYQALGVNAATYRGRGDPFDGRSVSDLCQNMGEVRLAVAAQEEVASAVCNNTNQKTQCPFFNGCRYYEQLARAIAADVVFVAHNFIFQALPEKLLADVGFIIIEEDFTPHGTGSVEGLPISIFGQESLNKYPVLHGKKTGHAANYSATNDLSVLYRKIERALTLAASEQSTVRDALRAVGLTADEINTARALTWQRKRPRGMYPAMPFGARQALAEKAAHHLTLPRIAIVLHALEALANESDAGNGAFSFSAGAFLTVHRLKKPDDWLTDLPILIPSASVRPDLVRHFFPSLEVVSPPAPALPHQVVHQYLGSFGKEATAAKLRDLVAEVRYRSAGKRALVIVHMEHEHAFWGLPNVSTLHHGDVAGDDDFGDVDIVFHIGGPFPKTHDTAKQASAEAGQLIEPAKLVRTPCTALMADGTGVTLERLAYEDPRLQAVHEGVYDQSFVQGGLGRGRGINRTADTPLEIHVYGNVPLPVPVTTCKRWKPIGGIAEMAVAGRVHFNAHDMARFHPGLFSSWQAAAHANQRCGDSESTVRAFAANQLEPWVRVRWQPKGQGHKIRDTLVPRPDLPALRGEILCEFPDGLATWSIAPFTPGAAPRPARNECAKTGKNTFFPELADSFTAALALGAGQLGAGAAQRPPDG